MGFLTNKKEMHLLEGRRVVIKYFRKIPKEQLELFKKVILEFCLADKRAKCFPKLVFVLVSEETAQKKEFLGLARAKLEQEIWIVPPRFYNIHRSLEVAARLYSTLVHEVTHLWHELKSGMLSLRRSYLLRLMAKEKQFLKIKPQLSSVTAARIYWGDFFRCIFAEGVARYVQNAVAEQTFFDDETYLRLTDEAKDAALALLNEWQKYLHSQVDEEFYYTSKSVVYPIGFHLVYSTLYANDDLTFEQLVSLPVFAFIKRYESAVIKLNQELGLSLSPTVSVTSGIGIIDYKRLLAEWTAFYKSKTNK